MKPSQIPRNLQSIKIDHNLIFGINYFKELIIIHPSQYSLVGIKCKDHELKTT